MNIIDKGKAEYEKEVLFKTRSMFRINKVFKDYIELVEVSPLTRPDVVIYRDTTYLDDEDVWNLYKINNSIDDDDDCEESFLEKYG